jgi:hypothetical protein
MAKKMKSKNNPEPDLEALAREIFGTLARQFPVCMASDEFHYFPQALADTPNWSQWDDFSAGAMARVLDRLCRWEEQLALFGSATDIFAQTLDADMLLRALQTLREQFDLARAHETQPTFYLTIAGIGLADAVTAGAPAIKARLGNLPAFFDQACRNLSRVPRLFRDLGLEMLAKQRRWVNSMSLSGVDPGTVNRAFDRLASHLLQAEVCETFLPPVELYEKIAVEHMGCHLTPGRIACELDLEICETRSDLERFAAQIEPGRRWQAVIEDLPRPPIPVGGVRQLYRETIDRLADHCRLQGVLDADLVRQCPVTVAPIPDYMRPVRSDAAFSAPPVHPPRGGTFFILENGRGPSIPADYRLLAAHETFPGHHLLDTCRWGHQRLVRRHVEFPIFYEGWASLAEELMFETGFFGDAADRLLMAKRRFWRAVRGKADYDIHMRRRSLNEVVADLVEDGMAPLTAEAMVRRYCLKPGYQLAYTIGRRRFRTLYERFCRDIGGPIDFTRRVLAEGEIGFHHLEQVLR